MADADGFKNLFRLQNLELSDFPDVISQLRPLMHCICLVYSRSTYYNSPARIIVLLQETCNLLVDAGRKYLDPASLFQVDIVFQNAQCLQSCTLLSKSG
jgi:hypothetical protein